jgi:hypothetical protein
MKKTTTITSHVHKYFWTIVPGKTPEGKPVQQICGFYYFSAGKYRDLLQNKSILRNG